MDLNNYLFKILSKDSIIKSVTFVALIFGFQQAQAQNSCAAAQPITAGNTTIAAIDGANILTACSDDDKAEWFVYTPSNNYTVTVTSDLPSNLCKDTHFVVYTGACGNLTCYTSDDDSGVLTCNNGTNTNSYLSTKTFDVIAGTSYYIMWDNRWGGTAGFVFSLTEAPFVPSPCATATPITAGTYTAPTLTGNNATTNCSTASLAKWYSYTPSQDYNVTVSSDLAANLCKDTNFSVYTGSCSGVLNCVASDDNSGVLQCNSGNTNSNLSKKTFPVTGGVTYYIAWDNKWSAQGFVFNLTEEVIVVPVAYTTQNVATINSQYNICVVDMNGDGKDDIAGVSQGNLRVHHQGNAGAFTFQDYAISGNSKLPSWSLAAGDFNKDGFNDLLLGDGSGLSFWKSNATGTAYINMTPGQYIFCQRTNFVDLNNDGHLDAFSCHDIDPNVYYMNDGAGNFTYYQSGTTPGAYMLGITPSGGNYASLWTDYDNDGDADLFISKCSGPPCELHRNDGNGVFTDISALAQVNMTPVDSWSSAIADFDNDGDMDILIGSNGGVGSKLLRNNLDTTNSAEEPFTNITMGSGWESNNTTNRDYIAYDFDNDGFVDIMSGGNRIMFNQGDGTFLPTMYNGIGVGSIGDLNNDGFLDILNGSTIRYAVPNGNKWMKVILKGIQSNSNGIGARVELYGAWGKQIRDVRSGEGFEYMSTLNTHFGIGQADVIEKVVIKWPSGAVDTIMNPAPNQSLTVVEGSTLSVDQPANSVSFSVYPNPADQEITVALGASMPEVKSAEVYDLNGRLVLQPVLTNNTMAVRTLSAGTYILVLKAVNGTQYTQKFIKK